MFLIGKLGDATPLISSLPQGGTVPPVPPSFFGEDAMDRLRAWAEKRREQLLPTLTAMEKGKMHTRELRDGQFADTTASMMEQYREWIAELDEIIAGGVPKFCSVDLRAH